MRSSKLRIDLSHRAVCNKTLKQILYKTGGALSVPED